MDRSDGQQSLLLIMIKLLHKAAVGRIFFFFYAKFVYKDTDRLQALTHTPRSNVILLLFIYLNFFKATL